jgi:hypothetical protein
MQLAACGPVRRPLAAALRCGALHGVHSLDRLGRSRKPLGPLNRPRRSLRCQAQSVTVQATRSPPAPTRSNLLFDPLHSTAWRCVACAAAARLRLGMDCAAAERPLVAHSRWSSLYSAGHCVRALYTAEARRRRHRQFGGCGTHCVKAHRTQLTAQGSLLVAIRAYWDSWHFVVAITPGVIGWSLVPQ